MKKLTKLLLIHWHYFNHELIEFGDLNFLTGKNSSGKSTVIDAMQLVLLGDTNGNYFNKAANSRGTRTLKGYLLGELGDDEGSGFRSLRGGKRFSSYIVTEFYDDDKNKHFTAGCCFDVYSENDITRLFFIYDGEIHPNEFVENGVPLDRNALRGFLKQNYQNSYETTEIGKDYKTKLYGRLGGLRDRFASLLKKAVSFDPNIDIQQFISDFVCDDQQTVDVSHMQENIRSYKRLEEEASVLTKRIEKLEEIVRTYEIYDKALKDETLYSYLIDRASYDAINAKIVNLEANDKKMQQELEQTSELVEKTSVRINEQHEQRGVLYAELLADGNMQTAKQIEQQIAEKESLSNSITDGFDIASAQLSTHLSTWRRALESISEKISQTGYGVLRQVIESRVLDTETQTAQLLENIAGIGMISADTIKKVGADGFGLISDTVDTLRTCIIELNSRIRDEQGSLALSRNDLIAEKESLEQGVYKFPQDVLDLKAAVSSRLNTLAKKNVDVRIVSEVAEIKDDRWRNAIEGYLNTQKFYLIVPDEYFKDALAVFNHIKRDKGVYGTGLVDIEKLRRLNPVADKGSLAEEVETDDGEVRLFLNFTLGRVQKCDKVGDLRRYRTSVTDEGMLYQNFVVRAMNPERWKSPSIGQNAIKKKLEEVKKQIDELTGQLVACASLMTGFAVSNQLSEFSTAEIDRAVKSANELDSIPILLHDITSLKESLSAVDRSKGASLEKRIDEIDAIISQLDSEKRKASENIGDLNSRLRRLQDEELPEARAQYKLFEEKIASSYDESWVNETGYIRYTRELNQRGEPGLVAEAFPRELSRAKNAKETNWENVVEYRRSYNDIFKMGYNIKESSNDEYNKILFEMQNNKLLEYTARIQDAKEKALEQFQEDFISRLHNNIKNANAQIDELNYALKGANFGEDTYRFKVVAKPENKRFHDMIMDEMITQGGYSLFLLQFNEKYKDEIAELFSIITNENGGGGSSELERKVREYTDFRTYLYFDMEVIGHDKVAQRLSKTMSKKSGGETQTPFYVSVLASFAQLYRSGRDKSFKTSRLIIFDEAFSKMDSERIIKSVELLRKFNFQAILSAPPDKVVDIAGLVDRNICVYRKGAKISIGSFDNLRLTEDGDFEEIDE